MKRNKWLLALKLCAIASLIIFLIISGFFPGPNRLSAFPVVNYIFAYTLLPSLLGAFVIDAHHAWAMDADDFILWEDAQQFLPFRSFEKDFWLSAASKEGYLLSHRLTTILGGAGTLLALILVTQSLFTQ